MKKFFAGIAAAAIITVPMTSFALESMSKGALKKATGQAGVSIGLDNIVIYMSSQPTTTYWDNDGTSTGFSLEADHNSGSTSTTAGATYSNVGSIDRAGIRISYNKEAEKLITIGAILDGSTYGASKMQSKFGVSAGIVDGSTTAVLDVTNGNVIAGLDKAEKYVPLDKQFVSGISPLTIDVGTCQALTQGLAYNKITNDLSTKYQPAYAAQTGILKIDTVFSGNTNVTTLGAAATAADAAADAAEKVVSDAGATATDAQKKEATDKRTFANAADALSTKFGSTTTITDAKTAVTDPEGDIAKGAHVYDTYTKNGDVAGITRGILDSNANIVGVVIGLPTVEISTYHTNDRKTISVLTAEKGDDTQVANSGCQFIEIEKSGHSKMAILGGRLEIAPH